MYACTFRQVQGRPCAREKDAGLFASSRGGSRRGIPFFVRRGGRGRTAGEWWSPIRFVAAVFIQVQVEKKKETQVSAAEGPRGEAGRSGIVDPQRQQGLGVSAQKEVAKRILWEAIFFVLCALCRVVYVVRLLVCLELLALGAFFFLLPAVLFPTRVRLNDFPVTMTLYKSTEFL